MEQSHKFFNQSAATWDQPEKILKAKEYSQAIKKALQVIDPEFKIESVLEIGCGTGLLGGNFIDEGTPYLGIDSSEEMLKVLKQKFPWEEVQTLNLDVEKTDFKDWDYNFVISQKAFHHLVDPATVLKRLKKEITVKFAIVDFDSEDGSFHPDPVGMGVHHFGFSKTEIQSWCEQAGLSLQHYEILDQVKRNDKVYPLFLAIMA